MKKHNSTEAFLASGDYLAVVRDFALSKGISTTTLLANSDISLDELINPPAVVNNLIANHIGANLYNAIEHPISDAAEFGLSMTTASHGSLGMAVQCAPNLREAYDILRAFYNTRTNSQDIHIDEQGEDVVISLVTRLDNERLRNDIQNFFDLGTLTSIATNTYKVLDKHDLPGAMTLEVNATEPENFPFHKIVGVNVIFDQDKLQLRMPRAWMDTPLTVANPDLAKAAVEKCEDELKLISPLDLVAKVKARLNQASDSLPNLDDIAQEFHMSAATFKRKLKEQATTYQTLKNEERLEQAKAMINSGKETIENIASKLGFSDASNFTKAFKGWTGRTPKEYRDR